MRIKFEKFKICKCSRDQVKKSFLFVSAFLERPYFTRRQHFGASSILLQVKIKEFVYREINYETYLHFFIFCYQCFRATVNPKTNAIDWNLLVCYMPRTRDIRYTILPICMLISVFFIVATLLVYAFVPKLRNLNGKCLICYLAALAIGYSILSWLQIIEEYIVSPVCTLAANVVYFALIAAFLWLNVLNFDQWQCFK